MLGESILPFRVWKPVLGVVPVTDRGDVLDAERAANRGFLHLYDWMQRAETVWNEHGPGSMSFEAQLDYYGKLSSQFPIAQLRLIFAAPGTVPCAALLRDQSSVIEHAVYWSSVSSENDGRYLAAIFNSETSRSRVEKLQAKGQWGARHFDKVMFTLPIPRFDAKNPLHAELAAAGAEAEQVAAKVAIPDDLHFQTARRRVREALAAAGIAKHIDALVAKLLHG